MDPKRTGAIKNLFEQLLQSKLNIDSVDGWAALWKRHIPTVTFLISSGTLRVREASTSTEAYANAFEALQSQSVDWALLEQLKPEFAATGDNFEVAKFLVVLLHELRISQPALLEEDYGLSKEHNEHIAVVLQHLAHQHSWDPYDSWPAILFQSNNSNTAESIDSSTITPKTSRRAAEHLRTLSERVVTRLSPLAHVVSSPRSQELRMAREKDKKLKALDERCRQLEDEKDELERDLRAARLETRKVSKSLAEMTGVANEKELRCQNLGKELDDWRSRAAEAENELNGLKQQWKALKEMLSTCQRQLREAEFEVSARQNAIDSWQNTATMEEQWRKKLEREREELLQELAVTSDAKLLAEEQLRKRTQSDEAEIAEQRRIIAILRSELKTAREEMDEAIMKYEQQLDENRVELEGKIESKDFEIAELVALIAEMKQRLDALQISLTDTRVVALQVRNIRGELENASSEIRDLHFLLAVVQNRCLALKHENVHQKERIESLEKIIAVSNARSNALMASLEEQNKKHTETMTAKQADLQEKQLMLYDAWDRLRMSTDANTCLQEEMRQRDVAYQLLEQRLAAAEERCSTMSMRFSISSLMDSRPVLDETFKTNGHHTLNIVPRECHPLPENEDENILLSSSSVHGNPYLLNVQSQYEMQRYVINDQPELNTSVDSERLAELKRRNKSAPPHLRSVYPVEMQRVKPTKNIDEDSLRNTEKCVSQRNEGTTSNYPPSPISSSNRKYALRSLRSVKKQFRKMMRDSAVSKRSDHGTAERGPFKAIN